MGPQALEGSEGALRIPQGDPESVERVEGSKPQRFQITPTPGLRHLQFLSSLAFRKRRSLGSSTTG